jgi:hypothetical protein
MDDGQRTGTMKNDTELREHHDSGPLLKFAADMSEIWPSDGRQHSNPVIDERSDANSVVDTILHHMIL